MTNIYTENVSSPTRTLVIAGVCIALVFVATAFINLRLPVAANGGLIHLGNVPLFVAAVLFGRKIGFIAGAFGMAIFDLLGGWFLWFPFTFVIVGIIGYLMALVTEKNCTYATYAVAVLLAALVKVTGYYIAEAIIYSNWLIPAASIPGNLIQIGVAAVIALPIIKLLLPRIR